jgi:hypothetical protein
MGQYVVTLQTGAAEQFSSAGGSMRKVYERNQKAFRSMMRLCEA